MIGKLVFFPLPNQGQGVCSLDFLQQAVSETGKLTVHPIPVITDSRWIRSEVVGI